MKKILFSAICLLCPFLSSVSATEQFKLVSPTIKHDSVLPMQQVLDSFGCTGDNKSPLLEWSNPPADTKSFAITVYDPDAPTGSGWWHWLVFNIPAETRSLPVDAGNLTSRGMPEGVMQSITDFGKPGYGGACPPPGDPKHRYIFTIYALNVPSLDLPSETMPAMLNFVMRDKVLGKASFTAHYGR